MELTLTLLSHEYAITRLAPDAQVPPWVGTDGLTSITRADDELSIVCRADHVPTDIPTEKGWAALRVDLLAQLDEPGVVMSAITPISSAGLGVFVISTHLRDYILVRHNEMAQARLALTQAGHKIL